MQHLIEFALLITGTFFLSCVANVSLDRSATEDDWKRIEVKGRFSFSIPSDMKSNRVQGTDSLVGEYRSPDIHLSYDYGWYSDPLNYEKKPDFREELVMIDGKRAKLVTFRKRDVPSDLTYYAGVHFADLGDGQTKLTMWANCRSASEQKIAKKIFHSIKFSQ